MAPVDLNLVGQYYAIISRAMTEGTKIAVENAVRMVTMGLDGDLIAKVLSWVITRVIKSVVDIKTKALTVALRLQHMQVHRAQQTGKLHCGKSPTNHPPKMNDLLKSLGMIDTVMKQIETLVTSDGDTSVQLD
ncbi:hypothetical protein GUITHDRAFT_116176 [Guillardia theta CCMP2712]|uniref:Uncharacterized protein n=1 Tax=Guillardia theta (strain CCMP2712) TaxID=905079 RepID=L1IPF7_GUITC|nr:hypothetical protein GUITHDRAFT_116176 [Guillardia theta CCMP2712]EKX37700.1 hypothetical protein GUITHDRAFT_116176 [Guillardia theta CCMP2712]|eukprot:XP_005824680.1 hypothetical protein GUITHDRAFT_116176 [Guillardia theta CCMP2712]